MPFSKTQEVVYLVWWVCERWTQEEWPRVGAREQELPIEEAIRYEYADYFLFCLVF